MPTPEVKLHPRPKECFGVPLLGRSHEVEQESEAQQYQTNSNAFLCPSSFTSQIMDFESRHGLDAMRRSSSETLRPWPVHELKFCFSWLVWKRRQRHLRHAGAGTRTTRLHLQDSLHSIWPKGRTSMADYWTYTGEFVADAGSHDRRKCPFCHSTKLHRSHTRGYEALLTYFGVRAYRCDECDRRFYGRTTNSPFGGGKPREKTA